MRRVSTGYCLANSPITTLAIFQNWRKHKESNPNRLLTSCDGFQDRLPTFGACFLKLERVAGNDPAPDAWKATVLPLNYTREIWWTALKPPWMPRVYFPPFACIYLLGAIGVSCRTFHPVARSARIISRSTAHDEFHRSSNARSRNALDR